MPIAPLIPEIFPQYKIHNIFKMSYTFRSGSVENISDPSK